MLGEIIILAMFENEDAIFVQKVTIQYEIWNLREFLQSVRWIGKDEKATKDAEQAERISFAKEMLADKVSIDKIAKYSKLSLDEVRALAAKLSA